jgi:hypothetical protein
MNADIHQQVVAECARLLKVNHQDHEEIVRFLQRASDPYSIPFIKQAVHLKPYLKYLEYDDYGSYYKKCFWALRAIGTKEAIAVIHEFAASDDPVIKDEAVYRLSRIKPALTSEFET